MKADSTLKQRLLAKFTVVDSGCWEYTGSLKWNGYGQIWSRTEGRPITAHQASWLIHFGEIEPGLEICHHCDNRKCINPAHLFKGTKSDNMKDMVAKGRYGGYGLILKAKTHCPKGHPYSGDNLYVSKENRRHCRTCINESKRRRRAAGLCD